MKPANEAMASVLCDALASYNKVVRWPSLRSPEERQYPASHLADALLHADAQACGTADDASLLDGDHPLVRSPQVEPDNPAAYALARHIADQPVSTLMAAFRYLGWSITFDLQLTDNDSLPLEDEAY